MDPVFEPLATSLGASVDQIKVITCLLLSYPLATIYTRIHVPAIRHLFSIAVSLVYLLLIFELYYGTVQLFLGVLTTYVICANVSGPRMPWIVFVVVMGHLTINHLHRAFYKTPLSTFEITGPQMVLTMKLTTFAWNIHDGRQSIEKLDKWQKERRIVRMPSLLEFLGYSFYFPGMLVGPYLVYSDYATLVHEIVFVDSPSKSGVTVRQNMPAGRKRTAYYKMLRGLVFLGLYVVFGPKFNFNVLLTDSWSEKSVALQVLNIQVIGFFERTKYYAIWSLTEGAAIVTGLGFAGYDSSGRSKWDGASNVDILGIEFPSGFKGLVDSWNVKTNIWLRECIYKRVTPAGSKPGFRSSMITFFTSAFWHGIAGGYYMTFILGGFIQTAQRTLRSTVRPLLLPPQAALNKDKASIIDRGAHSLWKQLYDIFGTLASIVTVNYTVIPFILLDIGPSLQGWQRAHWYGHIIVGATLLFFWLGGKKWLVEVQRNRARKLVGVSPITSQSSPPKTPGSHVIPPLEGLSNKITI